MEKRCSPGTVCNNWYIPLPSTERYVTNCYKAYREWRRYVTKKKSLLHSVTIRGTVCNNLLHTVSLLYTVPHQGFFIYYVIVLILTQQRLLAENSQSPNIRLA
jgi:hypothetical protein